MAELSRGMLDCTGWIGEGFREGLELAIDPSEDDSRDRERLLRRDALKLSLEITVLTFGDSECRLILEGDCGGALVRPDLSGLRLYERQA